MKKILIQFFSVVFVLQTLQPTASAAATSPHCAVLLRDSSIEANLIWKEVDRLFAQSEKLYSPTFHLQDVFREKISNRWAMKRLFANTSLHDLRNPIIAEYFAKKMLGYVAGEKVTADDYIFSSQAARTRKHFEQTALEQVLERGLLTWAHEQSLPKEYWYGTVKRAVWIIFNSRFFLLFKPVSNAPITPSLLHELLENGYNSKSEEVQNFMKKQSKKDKTNLILRLLLPIVVGTLFIYSYQEEEERKRAKSAQALREAKTQLNAVSEAIQQIHDMYEPDAELERLVAETVADWKAKGLPAEPHHIKDVRDYFIKQRKNEQ